MALHKRCDTWNIHPQMTQMERRFEESSYLRPIRVICGSESRSGTTATVGLVGGTGGVGEVGAGVLV